MDQLAEQIDGLPNISGSEFPNFLPTEVFVRVNLSLDAEGDLFSGGLVRCHFPRHAIFVA